MTRKSSAVGMCNAVLRNNLKWREAAEQTMKREGNLFYFVVVNLDFLCTLVLLICDMYVRTGDGYVALKIFKLIEIKSDLTVDQGNCCNQTIFRFRITCTHSGPIFSHAKAYLYSGETIDCFDQHHLSP